MRMTFGDDAMIWLTDAELTAITDAARPLPPKLRGEFLQAVAAETEQHHQRGLGAVYRACRELHASFRSAGLHRPEQVRLTQGDGLVRLR
jgi:hypothetical protein